jgi:hypothetical protein
MTEDEVKNTDFICVSRETISFHPTAVLGPKGSGTNGKPRFGLPVHSVISICSILLRNLRECAHNGPET